MKMLLALALLPALAFAVGADPAERPALPAPDAGSAIEASTSPPQHVQAAPADAGPPVTEADVTPLFTTGALGRARADFAAGRYEAAAKGFEQAKQPDARYLRGVALVEARRGAEAVGALAGLERELPELADRIAYWRGKAADLAGDGRAAAASFAAVQPGSILWADAHLARARALERAGDRAGALEALTPILSLPAPDELTRGDPAADALLLTGRLRAAQGKADRAWARRAFVECWSGHPLSGAAASCLTELKKLPGADGGPPAPQDALRRDEALLDANRNTAALADLLKLAPTLPAPGPGEGLACRARFALGRAHRRERQHAKAIEALRPVVERCDDPQLRVRALYVLASSTSIVAPEDGVGWYRALARDYPAHPYADDALFYAADLLARSGHTDEALAALADLSERYPKGDFRAEALFRTAWIERAAGHAAGALAALARIERDYETTDAYEHARAVYWRGRLLSERNGDGDRARALEAWRSLVDRYPADYYGLLARARLEEVKPGSAPPWPRATTEQMTGFRYHPGALARDRHFRAGVRLLRMGADRAAADELGAVDRKAIAGGEPLLLVAELLDRAGDHKTAHNLVRTLGRAALRQRPEGAALRIWRVAYPQAYWTEVDRWGHSEGVPPDLLLALMREESGLDPNVVSGAGAIGLTQLMLPTAQATAKKLRMGRVRQADLMKPPIAIRIGAAYFGGLLRRYDGSEALALAAYNVGETPVRSWLRARGSLPLDAFVEEIPVQETRGYVKRVLRSYAAYRYLYGSADKPVLIGQGLPSLAER
jgi:soluble lytic murein transglycosylase